MSIARLRSKHTSGVLEFSDTSSGFVFIKFDPINALTTVPASAQLTVAGTLALTGSATDAAGNVVSNLLAGVGAGYRLARGQYTTSSAVDPISTGLGTVVAALVQLEDSPVLGCLLTTAFVGVQSSSASATNPGAGSIFAKSWKTTSSADTTPIAATTFGKKVNWLAVGTS